MVMIDLDRPRELKFGFKALKMVEAMTKKSVPEIMRETETSETPFMTSHIFQTMMYCAMKSDDNELKFDDVENILDKGNYAEIRDKLYDAVTEAYGYSKETLDEIGKEDVAEGEDKKK